MGMREVQVFEGDGPIAQARPRTQADAYVSSDNRGDFFMDHGVSCTSGLDGTMHVFEDGSVVTGGMVSVAYPSLTAWHASVVSLRDMRRRTP